MDVSACDRWVAGPEVARVHDLFGSPNRIPPADLWFLDQDDRTVCPNGGWWALRPGRATGRILGGNLGTLNLLQGTGYVPSLDGALLVRPTAQPSRVQLHARRVAS